jgi:hypothetical protein
MTDDVLVPHEEQPAPVAPVALPILRRPTAIIPQNLRQAMELATVVVRSGLAPRGLATVERAAYAMLYGAELGLPPMAALKSVMLVNGVPGIFGDAVLGLVRRSGHLRTISEKVERNPQGVAISATCTVTRLGEQEPTSWTYTVADAKAAGLLSKPGPWQTALPRMLLSRARTFALRDAFPDVLTGLLNLPEADDGGMMTIDGDIELMPVDTPADAPAEPRRDDPPIDASTGEIK